jgi:hypothetical protein
MAAVATLVALGTWGDVAPMLRLAEALTRRFKAVRLVRAHVGTAAPTREHT